MQVDSFGEASRFVALKGDDFKTIGGNLLHIYRLLLFSLMASNQVIECFVHRKFIADQWLISMHRVSAKIGNCKSQALSNSGTRDGGLGGSSAPETYSFFELSATSPGAVGLTEPSVIQRPGCSCAQFRRSVVEYYR